LVFWLSYEGLQRGMSSCASVLFIWREVYIVFLIHMTWGYVNNVLRESVAKYLFGFIAASGAIGGVIGGVVPSLVTHSFGPRGVILVGVLQLLASAILFFKTKHLHEEEVSIVEKPTPIASLKGVGGYVTFILVLVVLSQFCLGIVEFLFNVNFQNAVPDVAQKVDKLGLVYAGTNAVAFIIKLLVLPVLFSITTNARIQVLVPVFYLGLSVLGLGVGSEILLMTAISFVVIKGMDYSAFSVSKELLYYPLKPAQKFGAKYIIDMFAYRLSKAVISFALIFIQGPLILNGLLIFFLGVWIALVVWPTFPLARASQSVVEE
jgi:AAA family ATP:ADP antiporter